MSRREQGLATPFVTLLAAALCAASAHATDFTWSNSVSFTSDWSTPACWAGAVVPTSANDTNILFGVSTRTSPMQNLATPFALRSIQFLSDSPAYTLGGSTLGFATASTFIQQDSAADQVINEGLNFSNSITTLMGIGSGRLTLNGAITGTGSLFTGQFGAQPGTVRRITLNGVNTSTPSAGNPSLYIDGGGFSPVVVDLTLGNDAAIGTGTLNFRPGHILRAGNGARTIANLLLINGSSGNGLPEIHTFGAGDPLTFTGAIQITVTDRTLQIDNASTTFAGAITDDGLIIKTGPGDWIISGASNPNWTSPLIASSGKIVAGSELALAKNTVVLSGGSLDLNNLENVTIGGLGGAGDLPLGNSALTLNVGTSGTPTYQGSLTLAEVKEEMEIGRLIKTGAGQIDFAGPTSISTVDRFRVADGTFVLDQGATLTMIGGGNVASGPNLNTTIGGDGVSPMLRIAGGANLNSTIGVLVISGLPGTAAIIDGPGSRWAVTEFLVAGSVIDYGPTNSTGRITVQNGGLLTGGTVFVGDGSGGFGTLRVDTGGQVLVGSVGVNGRGPNPDQIRISGAGSTVRTGANLSLNSADGQGAHVLVKDGAALEIANSAFFSGSLVRIDVENGTMSAGHLVQNTGVPVLAISDPAGGGTALTVGSSGVSNVFGGTIMDANTGPGSFTKTGIGATALDGLLTYTGTTTVNGGSLTLNASVIGTSSVNVSSVLFLNGVTLGNAATHTVIEPSGFVSAFGTIYGSITNNGFLETSGSLTITGAVTNFGDLSTHRGSQIFFTGPVLVNQGRIDAIGGLFVPPANFINNGELLTPRSVRISQVKRVGTSVTVMVPAYRRHSYQLQRSNSLSAAFVSIGASQYLDNDQLLVLTDENASGPEGFYRVIVDP